uniref:Uncharacterized protein n=1 Tax=Anguilla anguilla TaxID=7936 RepID=A0A0E9UQZ9_ANGAN
MNSSISILPMGRPRGAERNL